MFGAVSEAEVSGIVESVATTWEVSGMVESAAITGVAVIEKTASAPASVHAPVRLPTEEYVARMNSLPRSASPVAEHAMRSERSAVSGCDHPL
jgi:hypothetical protein